MQLHLKGLVLLTERHQLREGRSRSTDTVTWTHTMSGACSTRLPSPSHLLFLLYTSTQSTVAACRLMGKDTYTQYLQHGGSPPGFWAKIRTHSTCSVVAHPQAHEQRLTPQANGQRYVHTPCICSMLAYPQAYEPQRLHHAVARIHKKLITRCHHFVQL